MGNAACLKESLAKKFKKEEYYKYGKRKTSDFVKILNVQILRNSKASEIFAGGQGSLTLPAVDFSFSF